MKINKENAMRLWDEYYGNRWYAEDFHGNLMFKNAYGKQNCVWMTPFGLIWCGWNLHHVLPKKCGGTNAKGNLICTAISTNDAAYDKIAFWIDNCLYQVRRYEGGHRIERIKQ